MIKKNLISLSIAFAFLSVSVTGILMYIKQKPQAVTVTHVIFGLVFIGFAIFHILNNWGSLKSYSKERGSGKWQKEFIVSTAVFGLLLIGSVTGLLEPISEGGRIFAGDRPRIEKLAFDEVKTNQDLQGTSLRILIEKNKETELPVITAWVEDSAHSFVENLFVPAKIALMPKDEEEIEEGHFELQDFHPSLLPTWQTKTKSSAALSDKETPHDNFVLNTKTTSKGTFYVLVEIRSKDKTALYEAKVDVSNGGLAKLTTKDISLIKSGLIEILN